jgi:hypothetical protein
MPFLKVNVDGTPVASVATDRLEVVTVNVGGACIDDDYADLSVSGGVYSGDVAADHRIWVDRLALRVGQVVEVTFTEQGTQIGTGRTIAELYPGQEPDALMPTDGSDPFAAARTSPRLRNGYTVRLVSNEGPPITLTTTPDEHGFGFHILWNNLRPGNASVSLGSYTLESLEKQAPGREAFRERVPVGTRFRLELAA